jgi:hypothetical protein
MFHWQRKVAVSRIETAMTGRHRENAPLQMTDDLQI